jgi:hypothetical protein
MKAILTSLILGASVIGSTAVTAQPLVEERQETARWYCYYNEFRQRICVV